MPVAQNLTVQHWEFNENGPSKNDQLTWDGPADHWDIYQSIDDGAPALIATVRGGSGQFRPTFYNFSPAPPTATSYYWVVGYDSRGSQQFSNVASVRQLLEDPSFDAGPTYFDGPNGTLTGNLFWTGVSTRPGEPTNTVNFIDTHPGGNTAVLGTDTSLDQSIYTRQPTLVSADSGVASATVTISCSVNVSSWEDPNDSNVWDTLVVEVWDMDDLRQPLFQQTVADNRYQNSGMVNSIFQMDYSLIRGKYVSLVFHAINDEVLPTTFELSNVDFSMSLTYQPTIVN